MDFLMVMAVILFLLVPSMALYGICHALNWLLAKALVGPGDWMDMLCDCIVRIEEER